MKHSPQKFHAKRECVEHRLRHVGSLSRRTVLLCLNISTLTQREYIEAAKKHGSAPQVSYVPKPVLYTFALGVELLGRVLHRDVPLSRYKIRSLAPISPFDGSAARDQLGWTPAVGTREGLLRTFSKADAEDSARALSGSTHSELAK